MILGPNFSDASLAPVCIQSKSTNLCSGCNGSMLLSGSYENLPIDILALLIATVTFVALASMTIKRLLE